MKLADVIGIALLIIVFTVLSLNAAPDKLQTFQVAVTKTLYEGQVFQTNAPVILCQFWDLPATAENKAWVMIGWSTNYMSIQNTNVQVYVYRATTLQAQRENINNFSDAARSNIMNKIRSNPQIEAGFSRNPDGQLNLWGVTNRPVAAP